MVVDGSEDGIRVSEGLRPGRGFVSTARVREEDFIEGGSLMWSSWGLIRRIGPGILISFYIYMRWERGRHVP
jgi:hypothetical protein